MDNRIGLRNILPKGVKKTFIKRLENIDLKNTVLASREFHEFFTKPLGKRHTKKVIELLECTIDADWSQMKKIVDKNPFLMFEYSADVPDVDGVKKNFSAVGYVFYVGDKYGQDIFEACARKHGRLKQFLDHACEQKVLFDRNPFLKVYEEYLSGSENNPAISSEMMDEYWRDQVGDAQFYKLPRHMLIQICAQKKEGHPWSYTGFYPWTYNEFDNKNYPEDCNVSDWDFSLQHRFRYLLGLYVNSPAGKFALTRCALMSERAVLSRKHADDFGVSQDLAVFKHLFSIRDKQQAERLSRIEQELSLVENTEPSAKRLKA